MVEKPVMFVPAQEIGGLTYAPGQRWTHNCMECECLVSQRSETFILINCFV